MVDLTQSGEAAAHLTGLGRRRPTGEPPPLPRRVDPTTRVYVVLVCSVVALWIALLLPSSARAVTSFDDAILAVVERLRTGVVDDAMRALHALGSEWTFRLVAWPTLLALVVLRRFQRLIVLLGVTLTVVAINAQMSAVIGRMRPPHPDPLTPWVGYSHPSAPVAGLGLVSAGALYTLVPAGRWRTIGAWAAIGAVAALGAARIYLAIDHPTDVLAGAVTGLAVPAVAFRLLTPDEVMPVSYTRGRRAHLQVSGRREAAIIAALRAQMGIDVVSVEPFALGGSAGSTPVRLQTRGDGSGATVLFGKLYANVHLRSDRWFKLARAVMYGRLEDERSFNTVRRLVEYEDHMLRVARDAGLPTAEPYGFVEITPEREYLLVTEFLTGGEPLSADVVDAAVIDDALRLVRVMWNSGLAHRDIKPGNLLVRDGHVLLIDLAFGAMRPSPWRQAVDLANMMVTLALYATPEDVYARASRIFTPDEIAEAFAASRSATIPTQLRLLQRKDGRHVAAVLRALAPTRPPIAIQRWTVRRVVLTIGVLLGAFVAVLLLFGYLVVAGLV